MKTIRYTALAVFVLFALLISFSSYSQVPGNEPWTKEQLMDPADLARIIADPNVKKPVIFSIGPSALIKNSVNIGIAKEKENIKKLKQELSKLSKDADIVIYCGCCPFANCPNIRPAFALLNEMKFTHHKLLNLKTNIKVDWLNKGYPRNE
jgi:thiosulfate/3-mercaptopyruvate sulfurtransferase